MPNSVQLTSRIGIKLTWGDSFRRECSAWSCSLGFKEYKQSIPWQAATARALDLSQIRSSTFDTLSRVILTLDQRPYASLAALDKIFGLVAVADR